MVVLKCKKCGGNLEPEENKQIVTCEYCGAAQTIPRFDDEKKIKLFARANRLRFNNEFDSAISVYESIIADFPEEAEAYWGLILSKYGIEYVDDPLTGQKIPTCHRSSFSSLLDDEDFKLVMEYSDALTRKYYREEAKQIEELRKSIIEISNEEEAYDIFICYKETDENGERTLDSVLGYELYMELTSAGYRVFFSRISLEDKLGKEYEPYIFAALHSAKIMLAIGTDYEYYNAVWVKNEWSRFLSLIVAGEKKTLIPCYKNIDVYDMPREFQKLQAQDLGKIGATQDILHGINKIIGSAVHDKIKANNNDNSQIGTAQVVAPLIRRIELFLEDSEFTNAGNLCEQVLNQDPENAIAYLYKYMALNGINEKKDIYLSDADLLKDTNFSRAYQFGDNEMKHFIQKTKFESLVYRAKQTDNYTELNTIKKDLLTLEEYPEVIEAINDISNKCRECAKNVLVQAAQLFESAKVVADYKNIERMLKEIDGYPDVQKLARKCKQHTTDWRLVLESIIQKAEICSNAKEIYNLIESNLVFKEQTHAEFLKKIANTVLVEKYYGNKKDRIVNEIKQYYEKGHV